jgi:hypothetical protein
MAKSLNRVMAQKVTPRAQAEVARFFTGLDLVEPGLVRASEWRPDPTSAPPPPLWSGVARLPGVSPA